MSEHYDQRESAHEADKARAAADAVHAAVEKVVDMQSDMPAHFKPYLPGAKPGPAEKWLAEQRALPTPAPALLMIRLPLAMTPLAKLLAVADEIWPGCVVGPERDGYMTLVASPTKPGTPRCRRCFGDGFVEIQSGPYTGPCPDCIPH